MVLACVAKQKVRLKMKNTKREVNCSENEVEAKEGTDMMGQFRTKKRRVI